MCGFVTGNNGEEGIKFSNGDFVPLGKLKLENLSSEQRRELENLGLISQIAVRKRLHELGNISQNILNQLSQIGEKIDGIENSQKGYASNCPVNKTAIEEIVVKKVKTSKEIGEFLEQRWWDTFKKKVFTGNKLVKAISGLILTIVGSQFIYKLLLHLLEKI